MSSLTVFVSSVTTFAYRISLNLNETSCACEREQMILRKVWIKLFIMKQTNCIILYSVGSIASTRAHHKLRKQRMRKKKICLRKIDYQSE